MPKPIIAIKNHHGLRNTSENSAWSAMNDRCYNPKNPNYKYYGGRGITVCDRWQRSFLSFYEDMGKRPSNLYSLERLDNTLGYSPYNCVWATAKTQSRNKRSNIMLTHEGKTMCLMDWAIRLHIKPVTLYKRISTLGWSDEKALTTPVRYHAGRPPEEMFT